MQLLPFKVRGKDFALPLDAVLSVGLLPEICFIPQSPPPSAGIILIGGELRTVWNTCLFAGQSIGFLKDFPKYIEAQKEGKTLILPAEDIGPAILKDAFWLEQNFYGLQIFRKAVKN